MCAASEAICKKTMKRWTEKAIFAAVAAWHQNSSESVKNALADWVDALESMIRDAASTSLGLEDDD